MDLALARFNMVEQQIRPWEVLDERVLALLEASPREAFVPEGWRPLAYADLSIPLGHGEAMMPPKLEARLLQAVRVQPGDRVLEIGTGSGYLTYLLARLGGQVFSVDIHEDFVERARASLRAQGVEDVSLEVGDASRGWDAHGPYDVIAVTGSVPMLTGDFERSLAVGGRLFVVVGEPPVMEALLVTRTAQDGYVRESLFETELRPLVNAPRPQRFTF